MPIEIEVKFEADAGARLPGLTAVPAVHRTRGPESERLQAEYYDTADLRLLRSGITLRRREGGHDQGWHLKLPVGPGTREEIQAPLGHTGASVPAQLADLVQARTRGRKLVPVATMTTLRQTITLLGKNGESLAEVTDDQVRATAAGSTAGPVRWREVEVELTGGDQDLLEAAAGLLQRAGLRRSDRSAKLERVLGGPLPAQPEQPIAQPTAGDVVTAYLCEHADRLIGLDPMVRCGEPDGVHKMRVATRRLRSTFRSFGAVTSAAGSEHVASELKWLGTVLGTERDAYVQAHRLAEHVRATDVDVLFGPVQARIQAHSAKATATSHAAVLAALNSERYYALLDALEALLASPQVGPEASDHAETVLLKAVDRSYRRTRRRMRAAIAEPPGAARESALHAARKAAKRARYAAEAAVPIGGKDVRRLARQMSKVQSVLGDYHDTVVGRQVSRTLGVAANLAGESAFAYGLFYERDTCLAARLDAAAQRVWQRAG